MEDGRNEGREGGGVDMKSWKEQSYAGAARTFLASLLVEEGQANEATAVCKD